MPLRLCVISDNRKLLGDERTKEFAACGGTIGRNLDNDWILPDPKLYVSGRHAMIDFQAGAYYLIDTSRNGVYINGADTPVGRGHPQRIFDGDQLRIGDFDVLAEVTAGDEDIYDDGMRDSVVRAQLVTEDESVELALVDENRMVEDDGLAQHLATGSSKVSKLSDCVPAANLSMLQRATFDAEERAAELLLEAAGLKPSDVAGSVPSELLQTAGILLKTMVTGVTELLQERTQLKEMFRISQTMIKGQQNNPLKFSPSVDDALKFLLGDRCESYLSAEEATRAAFADIKSHQLAVKKAMLAAIRDYMERFDPDELRHRFDQGLKRPSLLSGTNKLKYWELYEESYQLLTGHEDGKLPEFFNEEFARAYQQEVDSLKSKQRN